MNFWPSAVAVNVASPGSETNRSIIGLQDRDDFPDCALAQHIADEVIRLSAGIHRLQNARGDTASQEATPAARAGGGGCKRLIAHSVLQGEENCSFKRAHPMRWYTRAPIFHFLRRHLINLCVNSLLLAPQLLELLDCNLKLGVFALGSRASTRTSCNDRSACRHLNTNSLQNSQILDR